MRAFSPMRTILLIGMMVFSALMISCGQDAPPATGTTNTTPQPLADTTAPPPDNVAASPFGGSGIASAITPGSGDANAGAAKPTAPPVENTLPPIPPDAQYSLLCASFTSPEHVADATEFKRMVLARTQLKGWYVYHNDQSSDLLYGFYTTFEDRTNKAEYDRAQADRTALLNLVDSGGNRVFQQVIFVPITLPDPPADPAWKLENNKGFWTLQIAIYRGSPLRKQAAVDMVRDARKMGVEAYFRHDPDMSEVFIGSWPRNAVKAADAKVAAVDNSDAPLLVMPGPVNPNDTYIDGRTHKQMKVVAPAALDIQDPTLKAAIAQYPYTYVNGEIHGHNVPLKDHTTQFVPYPSYLLQIGDEAQAVQNGQVPDAGGAPGDAAGNRDIPGLGGLH
jgi:hypothetical protein